MLICVYCDKECKNANSHRNHERRCISNVDRIEYVNGMSGKPSWNKGLTKETNEIVARGAKTLSDRYKSGELTPTGVGSATWLYSEEAKAARKKSGGYREGAGRSKKFYVNDSFGNEVCLQSSYELECSIILNDLNVKWIRPKALNYNGKRYFADFYLMDFDIYLDPKNNYKAKLDEDKIEKVMLENNVKVFVLLKEMLTHEYIMRLIQP